MLSIRNLKAPPLHVQPEELPRVEDVNAPMGLAVVEVLRRLGFLHEARRYAYELFQRFPGAEPAFLAVMNATLLSAQTEVLSYDCVEVGSAVCLRDEGNGELQWWIIEDSTVCLPDRSRGELAADSQLAQQLIGRQRNELIRVSQDLGQPLELVPEQA